MSGTDRLQAASFSRLATQEGHRCTGWRKSNVIVLNVANHTPFNFEYLRYLPVSLRPVRKVLHHITRNQPQDRGNTPQSP
jgi:hypothetical protein